MPVILSQAPLTTRQGKVIAAKQTPGTAGRRSRMGFYAKQHRYYCGIDLHARRMYIGILDGEGTIRGHRNGPAAPEHCLATITAYREDLVVGVGAQVTPLRRPRS